jgi:hypothetical protein
LAHRANFFALNLQIVAPYPVFGLHSRRHNLGETMEIMSIETALRQRLIDSGASQWEIANGSGIGQSTVGRFLRNEASVSIRNFEAMHRFLNERERLESLGLGKKGKK